MQWENLTADDFAKAVKETQTCIVPLAVLERHGPHLPVGCDMLCGRQVCIDAANIEPAVVFPPWFLGQVLESSCFPGCITLPPRMLVELMLHMLDEIGRNGFTKIVLFLAHGGNKFLSPFLAQCQLHEQKPYQVYCVDPWQIQSKQDWARWQKLMETDEFAHADEMETSWMLAVDKDLVKMDRLGKPFHTLGRLDHIQKSGFNAFYWYGEYPENYVGDARPATAAKGKVIASTIAKALARFIKVVKADKTAAKLAAEFFAREANIRKLRRKS